MASNSQIVRDCIEERIKFLKKIFKHKITSKVSLFFIVEIIEYCYFVVL